MRIEGSEFGNITIDGKTYEHDVIIRLSGKVKKRQKKLSKRQYGTSHIISRAEAKFVFEKGCGVIIVGAGHEGNVRWKRLIGSAKVSECCPIAAAIQGWAS